LADAKPKKIIKKFKLSSNVKFGEELVIEEKIINNLKFKFFSLF